MNDKFHKNPSRRDGNSSRKDGYAPRCDDGAPRKDGFKPRRDDGAPRKDGFKPRRDDRAPRWEELEPLPTFEELSREQTAPQVESAESDTSYIEGRNAVLELLRSEQAVDKVFLAGGQGGRMQDIYAIAKQRGIPVIECDRRKLDAMSTTHAHQGVIAQAAAHAYATLDELFAKAEAAGEPPLFVVCDGIEDPHNLGAIIRSAESAGAHGVIIPKRRAAGLTAVTARASAGALAHLPVHKATNLAALLEELQSRGVWIYGAEANGTVSLYQADLAGAAAIVIGSEGAGLSRIVRDKCDFIVSIPMRGQINSLNASNAAAVLLYEAVRKRIGEPS